MKFMYRFSNLLGTVYKDGNVFFTPDGNRLVSPVGNRVTVFDVPGAKTETLPMATNLNISHVALSPDGITMIMVDEVGEAYICSLIGKTVIGKHHFHHPIGAIQFSPDGNKVAVAVGTKLLLMHAPGRTMEFNLLSQYKLLFGPTAPLSCLDWTSDSQAVCIGGEDRTTRVFGAKKFANLIHYSLCGHRDVVAGCFFLKDSLDVISVGADGYICVFKADTELKGLRLAPPKQEDEEEAESKKGGKEKEEEKEKVLYKIVAKHNHKELRGREDYGRLTCAAYHKGLRLLFTGFQDGNFYLHEMPYFNMVHSLRISDQLEENLSLDAAAFNVTGDWVGLASRGQGSLLVWEWQSETMQLQQRGHFNTQTCLAYSPDGLLIATGGQDGLVKLWRSSGLYFKTFTEHVAAITGVCFSRSGKVVFSASLDGTVRAFDLSKYRNFRTFTSPRPTQFSCLAVNPSGDIVCAASNDLFQIFIWAMKNGRLLDVLDGHESVISSLSFSAEQDLLASGSWDKSVKLWDIFGSKDAKETLPMQSDVTAVTFRPDGKELAVATLNGHITFYDVSRAEQTGDIKGRADLGYSRLDVDKVTAKQLAASKYFSTLCYSADGSCVLAAGRSKNVCIYSVADQMLLRKFQITTNYSLGGLEEFLDKRKMTEWGSLALVEGGEGDEPLQLPGVRNVDLGQRHFKPEVSVSAIQFSPTGQAWVAASTEGVLVYSQDWGLVFDPYLLDQSITPDQVQAAVAARDLGQGLVLALRLNERPLITRVVEQVPVADVPALITSLSAAYVERLLAFLTSELETTAHLQFYLVWLQQLMFRHLPLLKSASSAVKATLTHLQKNVIQKQALGRLCEKNKYSMSYILALARNKRKREEPEEEEEEEEDNEIMENGDVGNEGEHKPSEVKFSHQDDSEEDDDDENEDTDEDEADEDSDESESSNEDEGSADSEDKVDEEDNDESEDSNEDNESAESGENSKEESEAEEDDGDDDEEEDEDSEEEEMSD